ncbi:tRNA pseudouridine(38-40) synthase TruA [candidate division WOR-3 bacterium]|nr:tRNA pseudouridine(38-40) synthase TruA [candidate division WOR-3 bacterium]
MPPRPCLTGPGRQPRAASRIPEPTAGQSLFAVRNFRITLEFDGAAYAGWQNQPDRPTVQGRVESAFEQVLGRRVTLYGCSRTDAGVSARNFVASFRARTALAPERLRMALNACLPGDVYVKAAAEAGPGFHARHSARGKTYVYTVVRGRSPLRRARAWEFYLPLAPARMCAAVRLFAGTRDFRPFCQTRDKDGTCTIRRVSVTEAGDAVVVTVAGDRFLYKMVRRIVGALVACGTGRLSSGDIRAALAGRPHPPFTTAPAHGLVLDSVDY